MPISLPHTTYIPEVSSVDECGFNSRSVYLGYDEITETEFFAVVQLHDEGRGLEFFFALSCTGPRDDKDFILDALKISEFVEMASRPRLRTIFLYLAWEIISTASPASFAMVAVQPSLPEKALRKYHRLIGVFESMGYEAKVRLTDEDHYEWVLQRTWVTSR